MADREPKLDLSRIDFPSNNLSIRDLRRCYPEEFDREAELGFFRDRRGAELVEAMLWGERTLAELVFNATLGRKEEATINVLEPWVVERLKVRREQIVEALKEDYLRYGIAAGPQAAAELVRGVEAAGVAQAREHLGKGL